MAENVRGVAFTQHATTRHGCGSCAEVEAAMPGSVRTSAMRRRFLACACALSCIGAATTLAAEPTPPAVDTVLARLDDLYRSRSSVARMDIRVSGPRSSRAMRIRAWTKGLDHALIVIEAPPREAGIATLKVKDNLWNYLPKVARTIRVPASMMLGSWMGTDFTNDDLVRESSYRNDFVARVVGRSSEPPGWNLSLEAKPGIVGRWARIDLLVSDDIFSLSRLEQNR